MSTALNVRRRRLGHIEAPGTRNGIANIGVPISDLHEAGTVPQTDRDWQKAPDEPMAPFGRWPILA
jgi:hypothetical protein